MKLGIDIGASHIGLGLLNDNNELIQKKYIPYKRPLKIFNKIFTRYFTNKYIENLIKEIDLFINKETLFDISWFGDGAEATFEGIAVIVPTEYDYINYWFYVN